MGIFNNKPNTSPVAQDNNDATVTNIPVQPMDDAASTTPDTSVSAPLAQATPPVTEEPKDDSGDYIMADAPIATAPIPVEQVSETPVTETAPELTATNTEDNSPINDQISPAYPSDESAAEIKPVQETQVTPEATTPLPETPAVVPEPASTTSEQSGELSDIKEQALKQLSPLVKLLDQSPEEKFHTTMMMLQSTDDPSLVKAAYEAAQEITDDKTRAQALLDIVNEINYFNQQKSD